MEAHQHSVCILPEELWEHWRGWSKHDGKDAEGSMQAGALADPACPLLHDCNWGCMSEDAWAGWI